MHLKLTLTVMSLFMGLFLLVPATDTHAAEPIAAEAPVSVAVGVENDIVFGPELYSTLNQTATPSLDINLDTSQLFNGAQIMIDALSSPYLLIAGFGLGVAILAAIMKAVTGLSLK